MILMHADGSQPDSNSTFVDTSPKHNIELNKRLKSRKKNKWPKVVSEEGKLKKTTKPKTPKAATPKRPKHASAFGKTCRRALNFVNDKRFKREENLCQPNAKITKKRSNRYTRKRNIADLIALLPIQNLCKSIVETKKKRSKGCTRRRSNLANLTALPVCNQLPSERQEQELFEISHRLETCNDAFVNSKFHSGKSEGSLAKDVLCGDNHARSVAWTEIEHSLLGNAKWTEMEHTFLDLDFHDNGTERNPQAHGDFQLSTKSRGTSHLPETTYVVLSIDF
jgi:hypothetical protein